MDRGLPPNFGKILVANRGEIACRVMRTCKILGVKTVAVFSDADIGAQHVKMADEAIHIGEPPAAESYLVAEKILGAAAQTGAEAIHPGYGFLSENEQFADSCAKAGVKFIGPPSSAIKAMGSKSASKIIMTDAKVPVVPGYHGEDQSLERLRAEAQKIGFPLMIKAVLGGGGKGMRIVRSEDEFLDMLDAAKRESMKSFSDDNVLLERFIERPRHIEFQVFADQHGNAVHLYERDCSVQRRHQKVLEEAPAPGMTPELRNKMGQSAVDAARAVGYEGAGTVEFIFDNVTNDYFFMEMNTRLQVEHPVSEMITKRDLVQWQLHVAAGHPLPASQEAIHASVSGHALEARIYAEDPDNGFLPAVGKLHYASYPQVDSNLRVETGVYTGDEVSIFYDPMIAKLIVWAPSRQAALDKCDAALGDIQIVGCPTNIEFLRKCVQHPHFQEGGVETNFIEDNYDDLFPPPKSIDDPELLDAAAMASYLLLDVSVKEGASKAKEANDPWFDRKGARMNGSVDFKLPLSLRTGSQTEPMAMPATAKWTDDSSLSVNINGIERKVKGIQTSQGEAILMVDGKVTSARLVPNGRELHLFVKGGGYKCFLLDQAIFGEADGLGGDGCLAPMAGRIVKVNAMEGSAFDKGDVLVIVEAMKMEHSVKAPRAGTVKSVMCAEGDFVEGKKLVIAFEPEE